ncbi:uncharacterized protein SCHCODRAFT_02673997 [Schizophyllum commune H4-8]|uniref:uncharacterized protein n=1 Tax=Schizophyllum commune (strain H4-8 / FGSC 9210) TaxID=578458 RepID=UPI00215EBEE6|nr:uncharacterized protein SCHCODRAFT_02673997 [Schizophyllum commune H4-8]KAI5836649.1 hypothetical protein SCHCODRAFT_02673997 [Schizophyllum commune H4-8]
MWTTLNGEFRADADAAGTATLPYMVIALMVPRARHSTCARQMPSVGLLDPSPMMSQLPGSEVRSGSHKLAPPSPAPPPGSRNLRSILARPRARSTRRASPRSLGVMLGMRRVPHRTVISVAHLRLTRHRPSRRSPPPARQLAPAPALVRQRGQDIHDRPTSHSITMVSRDRQRVLKSARPRSDLQLALVCDEADLGTSIQHIYALFCRIFVCYSTVCCSDVSSCPSPTVWSRRCFDDHLTQRERSLQPEDQHDVDPRLCQRRVGCCEAGGRAAVQLGRGRPAMTLDQRYFYLRPPPTLRARLRRQPVRLLARPPIRARPVGLSPGVARPSSFDVRYRFVQFFPKRASAVQSCIMDSLVRWEYLALVMASDTISYTPSPTLTAGPPFEPFPVDSQPIDSVLIVQVGNDRTAHSRRQLQLNGLNELREFFLAESGYTEPPDDIEGDEFWYRRVRVMFDGTSELLAVDLESWDGLLPRMAEVHLMACTPPTPSNGNSLRGTTWRNLVSQ